MADEDKPKCLLVILQAISSGFSGISTMLVVNVFNSPEAETRAYSIIVCACIVFAIHIAKFIKGGLSKGNGDIEFVKGATSVAIGFSDAMFDIFAAVAILQPGAIIDMEVTIVVIGTFLGLSEELFTALMDLIFQIGAKCGDICAFHAFLIQIIAAMVQPAAMAAAIEKTMGAAVETDPPPIVWVFCFADFVVLLGSAVLLKLEDGGQIYNLDRCVKACNNKQQQ